MTITVGQLKELLSKYSDDKPVYILNNVEYDENDENHIPYEICKLDNLIQEDFSNFEYNVLLIGYQ